MDYLGDKTFEQLGLRIRWDYDHDIAPRTRDKTMDVDGKAGSWDFGADLGIRRFRLPCVLSKKDGASLQKAIRALNGHLFDIKGRPKTLKLILSEEPEMHYMVRYSGRMPVERIVNRHGVFRLPLTAFDPYAYAEATAYDPIEEYQYNTGLQYDSGLMYDNPLSLDWRYTTQYTGLYNYAYKQVPVRFIIMGEVINPRVTNQTTGQTITVSGRFTDSDIVVIDTKTFNAYKTQTEGYFLQPEQPAAFDASNMTNLLSNQSGDFLYLVPGKNSLMFQGGIPNATVHIQWMHEFI